MGGLTTSAGPRGAARSPSDVCALRSLLPSPVAVKEDLDLNISAPSSPVPPQTCRLITWPCHLVAAIPKALAKDHPMPPKGLTNQLSATLTASPPCQGGGQARGGGGEVGGQVPGRNPDIQEC